MCKFPSGMYIAPSLNRLIVPLICQQHHNLERERERTYKPNNNISTNTLYN